MRKIFDRQVPSNALMRIRQRETPVLTKLSVEDQFLNAFHEKLYFHEIDMREKMAQRLQIPMAILTVVIGFLGSMMLKVDFWQAGGWALGFRICTASVGISMIIGMFAVIMFHTNKYKFIAVAMEWDRYKKDCIEIYRDYDKSGQLVLNALQQRFAESFMDCASHNALINDRKAFWIGRVVMSVAAATVTVFSAFIFFYFGNLEGRILPLSSSIVSIETSKETAMISNPLPQTPPGPPVREVKEYKKPPAPPPSPKRD